MLYMASPANNKGYYDLTVTFELGTDPDIDTFRQHSLAFWDLSLLYHRSLLHRENPARTRQAVHLLA